MVRVSESALEAALVQLSGHAKRTADSNWTQAFLAGCRIRAAGYGWTTRGADSAVNDLFTLIPAIRTGTLNPFINLGSSQRWLRNQEAGRSTVWNKATRGYTQTLLFNRGADGGERHIANGIREDAIDVLTDKYDELELEGPPAEALAVLLTRDRSWPDGTTTADLLADAAETLGLGLDDYQRFTSLQALETALFDGAEWTPELLQMSELGPELPPEPVAGADTNSAYVEVPIEQVASLLQEFRSFATAYGIAVDDGDIHDLLASTLSSQFVLMAGPSGSGKSLLASALAAFFAKRDRRSRLEGSRFLARQEEFLGYYSHLAGQQFIAQPALLDLLPLGASSEREDVPVVTIEEANLSPIEGYMSALLHGLGSTEARELRIRLHARDDLVPTMTDDVAVPAQLVLAPYPRFFATINVDADSPAPARKVASRACVILSETPAIEDARASADILSQPSISDADGPGSSIIGRPSAAFARYAKSGADVFEEGLLRRGRDLSEAIGTEAVNFRAYQKALFYIAWYVELAGEGDPQPESSLVARAVDNALLHFVLPTLPSHHFGLAIERLSGLVPGSVLEARVDRLKSSLAAHTFGPTPDFWGALS